MRFIVVTGTGTGVGKTVVAAAIASCGLRAGQRVAVVKPVQTGVRPGEPADLSEIQQLTGLADLHEYVRYGEPLAPATAARRLGEPGPAAAELAGRIAALADRDLVIIEGAGGLLVRFDASGDGLRELATGLAELLQLSGRNRERGARVEFVLVTSAGLGSLHDAAATASFLPAGWPNHLVIGDWPADLGLAERCNLEDFYRYTAVPLAGVIPHGAGRLSPDAFAELAVRSLTPALGGVFDAAEFSARHAAPLPTIESDR